MELVFATNNKHKLEEIRALLEPRFQIRSLADLNFYEDIAETGTSLEQNADIKSNTIWEKFKLSCFSDDTGLEIKALNGKPGVYSARYAGENCSFDDNMNKVLAELSKTENRKARFRTVISLVLRGKVHRFEGIVEGQIMRKKQGDEGFGYDPIFLPDGYDQSFAEMSSDEKNKISHRGRAVQKLVDFLRSID